MIINTLLEGLSKRWWVLLLRGVLTIVFGVVAFTMPSLTITTLVLVFGVYAVFDGITAIWVGGSARAWGLLLSGVVSLIAGSYAFVYPAAAAVALVWAIAFWAVFRGSLEVIVAIQVRKLIENEWMLILAGISSILLGIVLFLRPGAGALGLIWLIGTFAIIYGVVICLLAFRLKSLPGRVQDAVKGA